MLDTQLLLNYSLNFFGYGNPNATVWFVGLEEAGGRCEQVVSNRLKLWTERFDCNSIVDGYEFHRSLHDCTGNSLGRLFTDPVPVQKTWDRLIRLQLALQGHTSATRDDAQSRRKTEWARSTSQSCLLELFPLPSPSVKTWNYERWTSLEVFQSRPAYQSHFGAKRALAIKRLIANYRPSVVIFYGSRWKRWSQITGFPWKQIPQGPVPHARLHHAGDTLYAVVRHPVSRGVIDTDFDCIGEHIRTVRASTVD